MTLAQVDWGGLVEAGRAKAIGLSWSEAEAHAHFHLKIPAEFVREGILTLEQYEAARGEVESAREEGKEKPLRYMTKAELLAKAGREGKEISEGMTRGDLILAIQGSPKELTTNTVPPVSHTAVATADVEEPKV